MKIIKTVMLRPFDEILAENGRTNNDMTKGGGSWNIYHKTATKCLTVLEACRKYFDGVVTVFPNEKINDMINRSDHAETRRVYIATTANGVVFDVYDHWFIEVTDHLPEELFDI